MTTTSLWTSVWSPSRLEKPAAVWEAVVLDRVHRRVDEATQASIIRARNLFAFADESYLFIDYSSQGTLLDIVNKASTMGIAPAIPGAQPALDELLAIFFTIELLRTVEALHRANFIHGDLKIDNCLIRLEQARDWSAQYSRRGDDGWRAKGLRLIDFGRAIDLSMWSADQAFVADWAVEERDCPAMRSGGSWKWETDYWGLAGIIYCCLFGKYMVAEQVDGVWKIGTPLKRVRARRNRDAADEQYWQAELWNPLFEALMNPHSVGVMPMTDHLTMLRGGLEGWLEENCQKGGKNLRSMLKKVELAAISRGRS